MLLYLLSLSSSLLRAKKMEVYEMEITFKAITSSRVYGTLQSLEDFNFGSNFNNPYAVVALIMCQEYAVLSHLPSRYLSGKVRKPQQCTYFAEVLVQRECFFFYTCASVRSAACQNR